MAQFPSQSSASGLWSLKKQKRAQQGLNWPPLYGPADDYFEYVTMLLPGNGTNGAQNNTFLDSSTNNFTITRNGNTTQGTFAPYGSNWSNYFDGTGDYLTAPSDAALAVGSTFTVEFWVYRTVGSTVQWLAGNNAGSGDTSWLIEIEANNTVYGGGWNSGTQTSSTVPVAAWTHIAMVCNSGSLKIYINGVQSGTAATSINFTTSATTYIGQYSGGTRNLTGYISNLRVLKGTALYTADFTPPTAPLTAITNTSLLTCQSNRFIDNSTNAFTITRNGDVSVQRFSPFSPTAPYAAGTDGGSGYFDGTGDYLSVPDNAALDLGTGDFTIECWIYPLSTIADFDGIIAKRDSFTTGEWRIAYRSGTGKVAMASAADTTDRSTPVIQLNAWNHIAFVRSSSTLACYANGVRGDNQASWTSNLDNAQALTIASNTTAYEFPGYMTEVRIVKGTAVYSGATYTVPTAPLTAITNTSLLCNFTNAGIIDNAEMNNLETVGNAQISTAQSKFGGASMAFDGSGDAVTAPPTVNLAMGTGDFTIEMWVYGANSGGTVGGAYPRIFQLGAAQTVNTIECYNAAGTQYVEILGTSITFTASTLLNSTWNHFAVTRASNSMRAFVNGTQVGSTVTATNNLTSPITNTSFIGASTASSGNFNGYIDDFRITKGYARYTANFTPPTMAFPTY